MWTRHPDRHMSWIIGKDVNGDLGGWGQAGGHGGAGRSSWSRGSRCAQECEQQGSYLLQGILPALHNHLLPTLAILGR